MVVAPRSNSAESRLELVGSFQWWLKWTVPSEVNKWSREKKHVQVIFPQKLASFKEASIFIEVSPAAKTELNLLENGFLPFPILLTVLPV